MEAAMNAAGSADRTAAEVPQVTTESATQAVLGALHQAWWFTLGLVVVAGEGTAKLAKTAVERGKNVEPSLKASLQKTEGGLSDALTGVGSRLKGVGSRLSKGGEVLGDVLDERIATAMARAGAPLLDEMHDLKAKLEDLAGKVEQLSAKKPEHEKAEKSKH